MALAEGIFLAEKYGQSWMCLLIMFLSTTLDVGTTQHQRSINNASRVIEDLLETYDVRLRPRFGGTATRTDLNASYLLIYLLRYHRKLEMMRVRVAGGKYDKNELKWTAFLNILHRFLFFESEEWGKISYSQKVGIRVPSVFLQIR